MYYKIKDIIVLLKAMVWSVPVFPVSTAATLEQVTSPLVTIAHPNLSGHLTFDELYLSSCTVSELNFL
jgi:hypothetical protein